MHPHRVVFQEQWLGPMDEGHYAAWKKSAAIAIGRRLLDDGLLAFRCEARLGGGFHVTAVFQFYSPVPPPSDQPCE